MEPPRTPTQGPDSAPPRRLCLMGDLRVDSGSGTDARRIPEGGKRLLVLLALHRRRVDRKWAAGVLWPEGSDERAIGNLRSAIWRLRGAGVDVLEVEKLCVGLAASVQIDVEAIDEWAGRIACGVPVADDLRIHADSMRAVDLLPGWYDEWVIMARERLRHRVLHALEGVSRRLSQAGRHQEAVEAAIVAASVEPLRDSAQRALIAAHVAEGNWNEARRSCQIYVDLLGDELGIAPPCDLAELLRRPWDFVEHPRISPLAVADTATV